MSLQVSFALCVNGHKELTVAFKLYIFYRIFGWVFFISIQRADNVWINIQNPRNNWLNSVDNKEIAYLFFLKALFDKSKIV